MPDLTPTDHAAEAERLLAYGPHNVGWDTDPAIRLARANVHALLAQQPAGADSEVVRRAVRAATAQLQAELADAKREADRMAAEIERLRSALAEIWHKFPELEADDVSEAAADVAEQAMRGPKVAELVPSTGEDQGESCERCGHGRHRDACTAKLPGGDYCICLTSQPVPDEGSKTDG